MNQRFERGFSKFVVYVLRILFIMIAAVSMGVLVKYIKNQKAIISSVLIIIYILAIVSFIFLFKRKTDYKKILLYVIILGAVFRIIWCCSVKSIPVSDFNTAFRSAGELLNGNKDIFFDYGYFARFPHLIPFTLYFAAVIKIFGVYSLTALKTINIIASVVSILLIYITAKEIFEDERRGLTAAFLMALFPASILYTAVYSTETIAIAFYIASLYYFILVMKEKVKDSYLIISAVYLLIGHLFRMTAQVIIIAYIMFIFIYMNKQYARKFKRTALILIAFIVPFVIIGYSLIGVGITDTKLWSGKEPAITSILKGSNIESGGAWNEEDAVFIGENITNTDYLKDECKRIIIERYTDNKPSVVGGFIVKKFVWQWANGDFGGAFWSEHELTEDNIGIDISRGGTAWYQTFYVVLIVMVIFGMFKSKEYLNNKLINIMYIMFCGYGLLFLILESQVRYGFIISWVFMIMAAIAIKPEYEKAV